MSLKTSAEVAASSVTESVDFAIGATIVLSVRGEASVVGPSAVVPKPDYEGDHAYDGNSTLGFPSSAASGLRVGSIVSSGSQIRVGPHSEVALLFSNGTIATIGANTRMAIKEFQQESFGRYEGNFSRDEEVSSSKLLLDLEVGSLVVDEETQKNIELGSFDFLGRSWCSGHHLQNPFPCRKYETLGPDRSGRFCPAPRESHSYLGQSIPFPSG